MKEKIEMDSKNQSHKFLFDNLSLLEFQIMLALASGKPADTIAEQFFITPGTINEVNDTILGKLELQDNSELFRYCFEEGFI
jgi:DNA-binding NarL/FixJ family response regulator